MQKLQTPLRKEAKEDKDASSVGVDDDSDYINMRHLLFFFILSFLLILIAFMVNIYAMKNEAKYPIVDKAITIHVELDSIDRKHEYRYERESL